MNERADEVWVPTLYHKAAFISSGACSHALPPHVPWASTLVTHVSNSYPTGSSVLLSARVLLRQE